MSHRRPFSMALALAFAIASLLTPAEVASAAGFPFGRDGTLTSFELALLGLRATPEPESQVVPRNTPTGLAVALEFGNAAVDVNQMLALLPSGLEIAAELVGPGITTPIELRGAPGQLLPIPPLVTRGTYLVRDIRLELSGQFFLRASPDAATIDVIERVLITQVTTRPLDAEEIRQKGIIFGDESFKAYNFTLALKLDSRPVTIDFPVVFDANDVLVTTRPSGNLDLHGAGGGNPLVNAQLQPVLLKLNLPETHEYDLGGEAADISIPGLLVIPGDVGFLNQFFSAMLLVSNGAPLGSRLSVRDLEGTIELPPGDDGVAGTADDPLAVAETGSGQAFTLPIVGVGSDGILGTGDDRSAFLPGEQGEAEYLLEGRKEGFHDIEFDIAGTLDGLPVGPVPITGKARGGVVVRNPYFNLTFSAPRTVRMFEEFTLFVNVTNTSEALANFVDVTMNALQLSGAELLSDPSVSIGSLEPGDSETLRFRFRSMTTGEVTASYLDFDSGAQPNEGDLTFRLAVGERGTPLSPDTLVLPTTVEALPTSVVDQALRVLGQAWSLATAPAGTVPEGVMRVSKQVVIDRALEVAEAGLRVQLGEGVASALTTLAFTWQAASDPGFDQLLRDTKAGEAFQSAIGAELQSVSAVSTFHETLSTRMTSLPPHLLVSVGDGVAGAAPITWEVRDALGTAVRVDGASGSADVFSSDLPNAGFFPLSDPVDRGRGALLVARPQSASFEVRFTATGAGELDLSLSLPRASGTTDVHHFSGIQLSAGAGGKIRLDLQAAVPSVVMAIDADGDQVFEETLGASSQNLLQPTGPQLLSATVIGPETLSGADPYGRAAALLFDREVRAAEADRAASYTLDANAIVSARTQLSGRLVYLFLEQPAGSLVDRGLVVSGLFDASGRPMTTQSVVLGSRMTPPEASGAIVSGRVLDAEGVPIQGAQVLYWNTIQSGSSIVALAQQLTGPDGAYQFDWVRKADRGPFVIQAADPSSGGFQERSTTIRSDGERLVVDLVMRGRGGVKGTVTDLMSDPVPGARVLVTSEIDPASFDLVETDGEGRYTATNIVVGPVSVKAVHGTSSGLASGNVQRAGTFTNVDVTINTGVGDVVTRVLEIDGADVTTPVPRARVFYLVPSSGAAEVVVGSGDTDEEGLFVFEDVPTGPFRIAAFDLVRGRQASKTGELVVQGASVVVNGCVDGECQVLFEEEAVGTITGEVRLASGVPAAGARVNAGGLETLTAADGTFSIPSVAAGSHVVSADLGVGRRASTTVNVVTGTSVSVSLTLTGVGSVAVTLLDPSGVPMPGRTVIRVTNGCMGFPVVTDGSGVATFDDVPVPRGYFKALHQDDIADGYAFIRHDGDQTAIALRFGGYGTISGTVVDANEDSVLGADVVLGAKVQNEQYCAFERVTRARQVRTGEDGSFQFDHVPVGAFNVSASSFFFPVPAASSDHLIADGEVKDVTLTLVSNIAGELSGTVYLPDGTTVAGPDVRVTVSGARPDVTVRTDASGHYSFAKIFPRGWYTIVAADPVTGKVAKEFIFLQADQDLSRDLRLLGQGSVKVTVLDGGGLPIEDAFVELKGAQYPHFQTAGAITAPDNGIIHFERVPEGRFTVTASDNEGRGGRTVATLAEDGVVLDVTVSMTVTGTLTGTYKTSDGTTPIPNAEVALRQGNGRFLGSTVSSSRPEDTGTFSFDYVPAGDLLVTAMDPLTGRLGESSARIETQDQIVEVEVLQLGSGTIMGTVTSGGSPVGAAEVRLVSTTGLSRAVPNLVATATTDGAGAFVFDGVPVGSFNLRATVPGLVLIGTASGFIDEDGQTVDVAIELAASGTLLGDVFRPDASTVVPAASLTIRPPKGTLRTSADGLGRYETAFVPIGPFTVEAQESGGPDAGIATGELAENETLEIDVVFNGTGTVDGIARDFDDTLLTTGTVRLTRSAPFPRDETASVLSDGTYTFFGIPVGTYHLALAVPGEVRRGTATGEIEVDGEVDAVTIKLADAGSVTGLVVKEGTTTPAPNTVIELKGSGFLLTALTGTDGRFDISGVPLGGFDVWAEDPVTNGLALASGAIATAGETIDVGTMELDTEPIEVESITPVPGATVVPDTPIVIQLSDPTVFASLIGRFYVRSGGVNVTGTTTLSPDGLVVTFTPQVAGAPAFSPSKTMDVSLDGAIADVFGRRMGDDFTSSFATSGVIVKGTVFEGSTPAPGVDVTLSGTGTGTSTVATDANGAYRFEDVAPGAITLQAVDPADGDGASASLVPNPLAGLVTVDLALGFTGSVTGQVYEHDGTTPVASGLEVVLWSSAGRLATTATAADGTYGFSHIPVGYVTVDVTSSTTGDRGRASAWVSNQQSTTLDVTMEGTGSLRLFVRDQSSNIVTTAEAKVGFYSFLVLKAYTSYGLLSNATLQPDGSLLFPHVLDGAIDVSADDPVTGLAGATSATITAGQELVLDLYLEAAGSVRVAVVEPDGVTPVAGAEVGIRRYNYMINFDDGVTDAAGEVVFENVPVSFGPYHIDVKVENRLRARERDVAITGGSETVVPITLVGLGTVSGQVFPPSGESLSANVRVDLTSLAAEVGGVLSDAGASDGAYLIEDVPVGNFRAVAKDTYQGFQGEVEGSVSTDGENVVVDIQLLDNALTFLSSGNTLRDGNDTQYRVLKRGALNSAAETMIDVSGGAHNLEVSVGGGAAVTFNGLNTGTHEDEGRELVTAAQDIDGVRVQRKIFVPEDGYFARYLEVFENLTGADVAVTATLESNVTTSFSTNGSVTAVATSSGDTVVADDDLWLVVDDNKDLDPFDGATTVTGVLATAFVLAGQTGLGPSNVDLQPSGIDAVLTVDYDLVVPANGRAVVLHFMSPESFRDSASAAAWRLRQLPPEALVGLGADELEAIVNFEVPEEGVSSVEALPALDGKVFGRLLAHDGVTPVGPGTGSTTMTVRFNSDEILYRRVRTVNSDTSGNFSFETSFGSTAHVVIPRTGYTVSAGRSVAGGTVSAGAASDFTGQVMVTRVDGLTATATSVLGASWPPEKVLDGSVGSEWRTTNGVSSATLDLTLPGTSVVAVEKMRVIPQTQASLNQVQIDLLGAASELLDSRVESFATPNGTLEVSLTTPVSGVHKIAFHFNGSAIRIGEIEIVGTTAVDLGNSVQDVVFTGTAGLRVEVKTASGAGMEAGLFGRSVPTAVQAFGGNTDSEGVYALIAPLPVDIGPIDVTATATVAAVGHSFLDATVQAALTADTTTLVDVVFPETSTLSGQVLKADGNPSSFQSVSIFPSTGNGYSKNADSGGNFAFGNLPADTYQLRISTSGRLMYSPPVALAPPASHVENIQIPPFGTVDLTVLIETPEGAPVLPVSASVTLTDALGPRNYTTSASGTKTITNTAGGAPFTVEVRHPDDFTNVTVETGTIASSGQVLPLTVVIPALGTLTGTVKYADAAPAYNAAVELSGTGVTPRSAFASGGNFSFVDVEALRTVNVLARHPAVNRSHIVAAATGEIPAQGGTDAVHLTLPGTGTVEVTVTEADGTTPIAGAAISILDSFSTEYRAEGTTNASGFRSITIVPEGSFTVRAELSGVEIGTATDSISQAQVGEVVPVTIARPSEASLEGTIYAADGVTPVPGATVRILTSDGTTELDSQAADAAGDYRFPYLLPVNDSAIVRAELPNDASVNAETTVTATSVSETLVADLSLPARVVAGTIYESDGSTTVAGVDVQAVAEGGYSEGSALSDATGQFAVIGLAAGNYELVATDGAGLLGRAAVTLEASDDTVVEDVLLPVFGTVQGTVLDSQGAPPSGVTTTEVTLMNANLPAPRTALPDASGFYSFDRVAEGSFTVVYDDAASGLSGATTSFLQSTPTNLAGAFGVTTNVSSALSGFPASRAIDFDLDTSWFTDTGDAVNLSGSPFYELVLPASAVVSEIQMYGNRESATGFDIFAGRFELFDSESSVLYDSGVVSLPAPDRDVAVTVPDVEGVTRIRFTPTDDESSNPGFSELVVYGVFEAPLPDIELPESGSVSGQLLASNGTPTTPSGGSAPLGVDSGALESRTGVVTRAGTVDATGAYYVTGVAEGNITVSVVDSGLGEAGAVSATVAAGQETTDVDVELETAEPLPVELGLPTLYRHLVRTDGAVEGELDSQSVSTELGFVTVNGKAYPERVVATGALSGRELVLGPVRMSGVDHTRKVFVPTDGAFARFLDVFENPHAFDVAITVALDGTLLASNLETSSGDAALDPTDRYVAGELDTTIGIAVVFGGAGTVRLPDASATDGAGYGLAWRELVVPAGGRVILMSFAVQASSRAAALTEAAAIVDLTESDASSDLTAAEKADIVNFIVP